LATFTGQLISATYDAIIKTIDNDAIGGTAKQLTDGLGNVTPLYVSTTQIGIGITPTEALQVSGNIKASLSVIATTFSGDLNGTINTATTGVTQTAGDNTTKIATTAFVQESHTGKPTGSGTGGKIPLWSGSGTSTVLTDSSITEESTQYLLTKDIRIFDTIPAITLQDSNSSGSASLGDIQWLDNAASQRAVISLNNAILGITSKHGGLNFGTNSTNALTIDGSQNSVFQGTITTGGGSGSGGALTVWGGYTQNLNQSGGTVTAWNLTNSATASGTSDTTQMQISQKDTGGSAIDLKIGQSADGKAFFGSKTVGIKITNASGNTEISGSLAIGGNATAIASWVIESQGIASNDNDTTVPTSAAVKDYVDTKAALTDTLSEVLAIGNTTGGTDIAVSAADDITFTDTSKILMGGGNDLQIYHDSSNSYVSDSGTGDLILRSNSTAIIKSDTTKIQAFGSSTDFVTIDSSGQVGIGIDTPTLVAGKIVHIHGTASGVHLTDTASGTTSGDGGYVAFDNPNLYIQNKEAGSMFFETSGTTALTIDSSQNATFSQNVTVGTTAASDFVLALRGGVGGFLGWDDSANKTILQAPNTRQLSLRVNSDTFGAGTEALLIDSSGNSTFAGNVGIGVTADTSVRTFIKGADSGTNNYQILTRNSSDANILAVRNDGNVGIGTTPITSKKLYVLGDTTNYQILAEQPSGYAGLSIKSTTVAQTWSWIANDNGSNSDLLLYGGASAGTKLTIDSSGKSTFAGSVSIDANSGILTQEILKVKGGGSGGAYGFLVEANNGDDLFKVDTSTYNCYFPSSFTKVGINASDPVKTLDVRGQLAISNSASSYWYMDRNDTTGNFEILTDSDSSVFNIDSSGNVGINAATPRDKLTVFTAGSSEEEIGLRLVNPIGFTNAGSGASIIFAQDRSQAENIPMAKIRSSQNAGGSSCCGDLIFSTSHTSLGGMIDRMKITAGGEILIGTGGNDPSSSQTGFSIQNNAGLCLVRQATSDSGANTCNQFINPNGVVGSIVTNGSATAFNTSSDYRLKENVVEMTGALNRVSELKPSRFNFIADANKTVDGFLAHEVQDIVPEAITGEKDAMQDEEYEVSPAVYEDILHPAIEEELDEDGNIITEAKEEWTENVLKTEAVKDTRQVPDYQGIDQSKLVPLLVGAIQELTAKVERLEQECKCK
jgi:hypothetical protein